MRRRPRLDSHRTRRARRYPRGGRFEDCTRVPKAPADRGAESGSSLRKWRLVLPLAWFVAVGTPVPSPAQPPAAPTAPAQEEGTLHAPGEVHLANIRQLTFGGENAEAYWSPDGSELILQSTHPPYGCDQIFRLQVPAGGAPPAAGGSDEAPPLQLVSTAKGRTTCAYFTADGKRILYSSTHLASPDCPPTPDHSQGYVWALYGGYEIFTARPDGSDLVQLTDNGFYDAEATVCPVDGSILFTSTRDGDLELYRMDADGANLQRLTHSPGYDGGGFFSADCSKIVWRASRPREGEELDDFRRLLGEGLVRPSKLEIWVANADGSEARQITYLDAASFAPYFFPSGERVIFSSNYGDPGGREFDLWAVDVDGTDLERITYSSQFDGFPMFSPDGKRLAFASNRNQAQRGETNIFVADWVDSPPPAAEPSAADRYQAAVAWLADDAREGRGIATEGLEQATDWLAARFAALGLEPAFVAPAAGGSDDAAPAADFLQPLEVPVSVSVGPATRFVIDGGEVEADAFRPASFSESSTVAGEVVAAGYGIVAEDLEIDDYADLDVEGKIVAVRRFVPAGEAFEDSEVERRYSDLRYKAWTARERGAVGMIVVDLPLTAEGEEPPEEAPLPALSVRGGGGEAGLPVLIATRSAAAALLAGEAHRAEITVELQRQLKTSHNVVAKVAAGAADRLPGAVVIGAHYDHLGMGGNGSLAPDAHEPHNGADDNASGVAALLEAGRLLDARRDDLRRDVYLAAFTGEESGLLGSTQLTRHPPAGFEMDGLIAMINMDMVGRLRGNQLQVLGAESAEEWSPILDGACRRARLRCASGGDGYGPSDQTPFYASGVPVLHFFSGTHDDYHKPSDDWPKINAAGGAQVARLAADLAAELSARPEPLTLKQVPPPPPQGDVRSYGASLGTIPDYAGPEDGRAGVLLAGVRAGGAAEKAGMQRGDLLVELAGHPVGDIYDFMFVLRKSKPGETVKAVVERDGERVELTVTFGESRRRMR